MANWEKLNKEFDDVFDNISDQEWNDWYNNKIKNMIKKEEIPTILDELRVFLEPLNSVFNLKDYKLLGSTRQLVEAIHTKEETKDIDILIPIFNSTLTTEIKVLKDFLKSKDIEHYSYFGNVVKFFLPFQGNNVHIDIMVSENNQDKIDYLSNLRFYSNEPNDENQFKGLHRTELIRSLLKSYGLVLGDTGIKSYKLKEEFRTLDKDTINSVLISKQKRAKKQEIINTYEFLLNLPIESYLNIYSNKYNDYKLNNRYNIFGITDYKLNKLVIDLFYDKVELNLNWKNIFNKNISDNILYFNTFEIIVKHLPIICNYNVNNLTFIVNDYIDELKRKNGDCYTSSVYNIIKKYLPFISIPEIELF